MSLVLEEVKPDVYKLNKTEFLQKTKYGFRVVHPPRYDLNKPMGKGNINWKALLYGGSILNLISFLLIFIAIGSMLLAYAHDTKECREFLANPPVCDGLGGYINPIKVNLSGALKEGDNEIKSIVPAKDND